MVKSLILFLISASGTCTGTTENTCSSCNADQFRRLDGNTCVCMDGYFDEVNREKCGTC